MDKGFSICLFCFITQDFECDIGLSQTDRVQRSTDLTTVLSCVLLGHPQQGHRGPVDGGSAVKVTLRRSEESSRWDF